MAKLEDVVKKRLRTVRENLNLNQSQFADKLGISQAAVSQFEDGKRIPSIDTLDKIATTLNMSIQSLLSEDDTDDDVRKKLMQDIQGKLDILNNDKLRAMNRFVGDWAGNSKDVD